MPVKKRPALKRTGDEERISDSTPNPARLSLKRRPHESVFFAFAPTKRRGLGSMHATSKKDENQ